MPQRMKLDSQGNVYVVYADNEGPWNIQGSGAVYKYPPGGGSPQRISPANQPFGDIAIHPEDDNKLVLVTTAIWQRQPHGGWGDVFYTSINGGETWKNINNVMKVESGKNPWLDDSAIHWCASLAIDPFSGNKIIMGGPEYDDELAFISAMGGSMVITYEIIGNIMAITMTVSFMGETDSFTEWLDFEPDGNNAFILDGERFVK